MYLILVTIVAALGGLLFGYDISVISGTLPFLKSQFHLSEALKGHVVSSTYIGCIFGAFIAGQLSDKYGRKKILLLASLLFFSSAIGCSMSDSIANLIIFRLIGGFGVGMAAVVSPMFIAEISPAKIRGRFVAVNQLAIVIGISAAYFVNYFLLEIGDQSWRWMFAAMSVPGLLFFVCLFFVPESPRWLMKRQKEDDALKILSSVGGSSYAEKELEQINLSLETSREQKAGFRELLSPRVRFVLLIGIVLAVFQQLSGINVIFFYAPDIFARTGLGVDASLLQTTVVGLTNVVFTVLAMFFVDRFGRKALMLFGSIGMAFCYTLIGMLFLFDYFEGYWLLILSMMAVAFFATSLGPVVWVIISEIFPNRIRETGVSVATIFLWIACYLLSLTFPIFMELMQGAYTFWLYAVICISGFLFILKFVPETKSKSLEEIEMELTGKGKG